jgi:hypothetical protein
MEKKGIKESNMLRKKDNYHGILRFFFPDLLPNGGPNEKGKAKNHCYGQYLSGI